MSLNSIGHHGRHRGPRHHLIAWPWHRHPAPDAELVPYADLVDTAPTADLRLVEAPTLVHPYVIADTDDAITALADTIAEANRHADPIDVALLGLPRYVATALVRTWGTTGGRAAA